MYFGTPNPLGKFGIRSESAVAADFTWRTAIQSEAKVNEKDDKLRRKLRASRPVGSPGKAWSAEEVKLLHQAVLNHGCAWDAIYHDKAFSALSACRTPKDLKRKWAALQTKLKKQVSAPTRRQPLFPRQLRPRPTEEEARMLEEMEKKAEQEMADARERERRNIAEYKADIAAAKRLAAERKAAESQLGPTSGQRVARTTTAGARPPLGVPSRTTGVGPGQHSGSRLAGLTSHRSRSSLGGGPGGARLTARSGLLSLAGGGADNSSEFGSRAMSSRSGLRTPSLHPGLASHRSNVSSASSLPPSISARLSTGRSSVGSMESAIRAKLADSKDVLSDAQAMRARAQEALRRHASARG